MTVIKKIRGIIGPKALYRYFDRLRWPLWRWSHRSQLPTLSAQDQHIVNELESKGLFMTTLDELGLPLTDKLLQAAEQLTPKIKTEPSYEYGGYFAEDIYCLHVPWEKLASDGPDHILWALNDRMLDIAERYIGVPLALIGADLRRDLNDGLNIGNRKFHMDTEEAKWRRELKVCLYLTDVTEETPCFEYIPLHLTPPANTTPRNSYKTEEMEQMVPRSNWKSCFGPRGTVLFLASNRIWHHARTPIVSGKDRVTGWWAYTSSRPFGHEQCKTEFNKEGMLAMEPLLTPRQKKVFIWY